MALTRKMWLKKRAHLYALIVLPILATTIALFLNLNTMLWSVALFILPPALLLSFVGRQYIAKAFLFSLTFIPFYIAVDYVAHLNGQWWVPSVFPRIFGLATFEDIIWGVGLVYSVVMFYEYFSGRKRGNRLKVWHRWMNIEITIFVLVFIIFLGIYLLAPHLLFIHFFYFWVGLAMLVVILTTILIGRLSLSGSLFTTNAYFFLSGLLHEAAAVKLGWWNFPASRFLGHINLLGSIVPFEEIFFGALLGPMAVMAWYKLFDTSG